MKKLAKKIKKVTPFKASHINDLKKLQKIRPYINGTVSVYPFFSFWVSHKNVIMLAIFLCAAHPYIYRKTGITLSIFLVASVPGILGLVDAGLVVSSSAFGNAFRD